MPSPGFKPIIPPSNALSLAVVILVFAACAGPRSTPATQVTRHLLPEGQGQSSRHAVFYDEIEIHRWDFSRPSEISAWTPERIDIRFEAVKGGLELWSSSNDPSIFRDVEIDARDIKALRVSQSGLTGDGYLQFYWAPRDEPFSEQRTIGAAIRDPTGSLIPSYTLDVGQNPQWSGHIARIRLDPTSVANRRMAIYSITALDYVPRPELVARVVDQSWRVDLRGDVRSARLAPPGFPFETSIEVPTGASLRFACGLEPTVSLPVTFTVVAETPDGTPLHLFEETVSPCVGKQGCRWHDQQIDLSLLAGERLSLRFETATEEPLDLFEGFPAWANIELVAPAESLSPPNVVMILLDTLRADRLSLYGYDRQTSPHIDSWAKKNAVIFENVVAPAPWTLPSHISVFTGLNTLTHGLNSGDPMPPEFITLAEVLREQGYTTHAITGGAYLTDDYGLLQGFDSYRYWYPPVVDPSEVANDIVYGVDTANEWLASSTDRPFFLFFHTYEIHTPYRAREPFFSQFHDTKPGDLTPPVDTLIVEPVREKGYLMTAQWKARLLGPTSSYERVPPDQYPLVNDLYDSGIAFADSQVKRLLDQLRALRLDRDTVIIITSDHGESLGENGKVDHKSLEEWEIMVPLIIAGPGIRSSAGLRIPNQVRLIDILPTVLDLVGLEPRPKIDGRSLAMLIANPDAPHPTDAWSYASSSNFGLSLRRDNRLKYIINNSAWPQLQGDEQLYRIDTGSATEVDLTADAAQAPALRALTAEEFERRTSGLRVLFSNQFSVPMEAHLKGHIVDQFRIKGFDLRSDFLEWRYQMVNLTVPPRESLLLYVEGVPRGEFYITARFDVPSENRTGFKKLFALGDFSGSWQTTFDGKAWHEEPDTDLTTNTGVRVRIHGRRLEADLPLTINAQKKELLRKLGYVH